ncbi:MAG: hypothetical protein JNM27_12245 [Leptospirales bacterium]|nr:hypothetical protein [Leptospirales bacterium]
MLFSFSSASVCLSVRARILILLLAIASGIQAESEHPSQTRVTVERVQVSGPSGTFVVLGMLPEVYLLDAYRTEVIKRYLKANPETLPVVVVLYGAYEPDLLGADGEPTKHLPKHFEDHLHDQCYIGSLSEYQDHSGKENTCYLKFTVAYLSGDTFLYRAKEFWDGRRDFSSWTDIFPWLLWFVSLVILSIPSLVMTLGVIGLLRKKIRARPQSQLVAKVCIPLLVGVAWFTAFIFIQDAHTWRGILAPFRLLVPLGGIFCGLSFVPIIWLADHAFFPENDPPRLWLVALLYFIAPLLIVAAAGARGGGGLVVTPGRSGGSGSGVAGGGGRFGGGGASATF